MIRPTKAGVGVLVAIAMLFLVGRLLGILELFLLGSMVALAVLFAVVFVLAARLNLTVSRAAAPAQLRVGTPARVDLTVVNQGRRRTPSLSAHDQIQGGRGPAVLVAPLRSGSQAALAYRLPTKRRGPIRVGPLELTVSDPLGLFQAKTLAAKELKLVVLPEVKDLPPFSAVAGRDPAPNPQALRALASSGDEFFALRPYVIGDELKRVNWRASARLDDLVVRQEDQPRTGRVTIALDLQRETYEGSQRAAGPDGDDPALERAITVTASLLHAALAGGDTIRFASTGGRPTDIRSRAELSAVEEELAVASPTNTGSLTETIEGLVRTGRGGTLVVVSGDLSGSETVLGRAQRSFGLVVAVECHAHDGPNGQIGPYAQGAANGQGMPNGQGAANGQRGPNGRGVPDQYPVPVVTYAGENDLASQLRPLFAGIDMMSGQSRNATSGRLR